MLGLECSSPGAGCLDRTQRCATFELFFGVAFGSDRTEAKYRSIRAPEELLIFKVAPLPCPPRRRRLHYSESDETFFCIHFSFGVMFVSSTTDVLVKQYTISASFASATYKKPSSIVELRQDFWCNLRGPQ